MRRFEIEALVRLVGGIAEHYGEQRCVVAAVRQNH
jgi:hypothetical protein